MPLLYFMRGRTFRTMSQLRRNLAYLILIVIGILVGVLAEMYIVKHKLNERERNK